MASASCAICGLAIRKGVTLRQIGISGPYIFHAECRGVEPEAWSVHRDRMEDLRNLERQIVRIEEKSRMYEEDLRRARRNTGRGRGGNAVEVTDLERRLAQSEEKRYALHRRVDDLEADTRRRSDFEKAFMANAVGLAVSRGVWGFAAIAAQAALDTKDDAEARYALLELS